MKCLALLCLLMALHQAHGLWSSCKPLTHSFCQGLGYTTTSSPSGVTGYNMQQISQMVETACSRNVALVLCRSAVPECDSDNDNTKKPCRSVCDRVKSDCEPVFRSKRLSWPSKLRCESLPENNCIQGQDSQASHSGPSAGGVGQATRQGGVGQGGVGQGGAGQGGAPRCEQITSSLCQGLDYTDTIMPNHLGHRTQDEAYLELQQFLPLIRVECSPQLQPFLCSIYAPECEAGKPRPACRTLCEQARAGCESLMNKFGFTWPETLKCDGYTTEACVRRPAFVLPTVPPGKCQKITVHLCQGLPYTETVFPNPLGHITQGEAEMAAQTFTPLVQVECSPHLKPFLCSLYTPECVSGRPRPPCRALCEQARTGCEPLMNRFGFTWPESMRCEKFTSESCEHYGVSSVGGICEPITIPVCQGLSYNQTMTPNLLGHVSQRDAMMKMSFFNSFVQTMCSVDIRFFVCTVYAPKCVAGELQKPCRSFCQRAREGCESRMRSFGISWPEELQCNKFPDEMCLTEDSRDEMLTPEDVVVKLNAGGYSIRGNSPTLRTARLLVALMDTDKSEDLNTVEVFKMEHYVASVRREYLENYEKRNPPAVTQSQLKRALTERGFDLEDATSRVLWRNYRTGNGIEYDDYLAVLTKLHILRDRFQTHLLNLPCDCEVASFSFSNFMRSTIF
ncbi:uncharacterized protein LOC141801260 [Halichoeres trimaculatus]|uniref:uncharacterized protein LOC141801260 n=1 Tax=Halichoeres trimaculatus TaxID=147232 RepID=UPI003D9F41D7